jgi:putative DNA primase/helicase
MTPSEIARALADRIAALTSDLLPNGHREGQEWCVGNVRGEPGSSLKIRLTGKKAGVWSDFAAGEAGDALDLVRAVLGIDMAGALRWARRWLGITDGRAELPRRPAPKQFEPEPDLDPDSWRKPWQSAHPITGTSAETYLIGRKLWYDDPIGQVLRDAARRARKNPDGVLEYHPAMLCALSDTHTGQQCGIINIFLQPDGSDRIRDRKGKTVTGHAKGVAVMLSEFCEPTMGLVICEGPETGIALFQREVRPVWACGGAGNLASFPVLGGIECLTVAADPGAAGQKAAAQVASRWRQADREVEIITPPSGDWADPRL